MKRRLSKLLVASFLSSFFMIVTTHAIRAETIPEMVTMIVHEDESDSEHTSLGNRPVALYDITSMYLEAKQAADFDEKKFSESLSDKVLLSDEGLPAPIKTATTNSEGECTFTVPMKNGEHFAVYLVRETSQTQTKKVLPSVIILPIRSVETNEILTTIDVYPKFIDGTIPSKPVTPTEPSTPDKPFTPTEPSTPEEPYVPTEPSTPTDYTPTTEESSKFGRFPSTNELKTKASWLGASIVLFAGLLIFIKKRQTKGEKK